MELDSERPGERRLPKTLARTVSVLCILTSLFYLLAAYHGEVGEFMQRAPLVLTCFIIVFLTKPFSKSLPRGWCLILDSMLVLLSIVTCAYMISIDFWTTERLVLGATSLDVFFGAVLLVLVLEGCRRTVGWPLTILALLALLYARFGGHLPGALRHSDYPWDYVIEFASLSTEAIWGMAMHVCATVIVIFIIFSGFLQTSGGTWLFIDLPRALFGQVRGGPAKIAVVGSALFGTISGSPMANVVATGTFTIPMMKGLGYKPETAGAIEALASTGGQYMPPIMGITAFIIPQVLGISYWEVCVAAFIPAILFYITLFIFVDLEALKLGIRGLPRKDLPSVRKTIARGWPLLVPLFVLIYLLGVLRWSAMTSAFWATLSVVVAGWFKKETRMGPREILLGLSRGMRAMPTITMTCAAAGILIGMLSMGGMGIHLSLVLVELSHGITVLLLLLAAVVSLIMGTLVVTTVIYLLLAFLVAPALVNLGILPLAAHLFVFYYGVLSCITPPVAVACYAAAPIAQVSPFKIGWVAARMGIAIYLLPFLFVYRPALIMQGTWSEIAVTTLIALVGCFCFAVMAAGYLSKKTTLLERVLFGTAGFALLYPALLGDIIGLGLLALVMVVHLRRREKALKLE